MPFASFGLLSVFFKGLYFQRPSSSPARPLLTREAVVSEDESRKLLDEQLSRNTALYGEEGMRHIRDSFVIVVGLGGVGR